MVSIEYGYDYSSNRTFAYDARVQSGWPMNHACTNEPLYCLTAAMRNTRANLTGGTPTNGPDNTIGWDGYVFNPATADYLVRHRTYLPPLGRWGERDPIGYADALNLFQMVGSRPIKFVDPQGLQASPPLGGTTEDLERHKQSLGGDPGTRPWIHRQGTRAARVIPG